ncbi:hypothetical protein XENOCAPTIV_029969 [Xenoophorus captivus]|uniref:C2 domain-containing protein n=1 Tax=Xenoophorus captivus TaxID=1517983 RepID=A0ABV0QBV4_9TELE
MFVYLRTDYQVQINLHHDGVLISSRETHRHSCPTWSSSFVFELPPGDINQLPISLQFIIMQTLKLLVESSSVQVLQKRDVLTGGTCAACMWSWYACTLFTQNHRRPQLFAKSVLSPFKAVLCPKRKF